MPGKRLLDRASYDSDSEFERVVDEVCAQLDIAGKRELMFSLMRECRGCGNATSYDSTEQVMHVDKHRGVHNRQMRCRKCGHAVPIQSGTTSIGQLVTLWNNTPLTIEGAAHA